MTRNKVSYYLLVTGLEKGKDRLDFPLKAIRCSFGNGSVIVCDNIPAPFRIAWYYCPKGVVGYIAEIEFQLVDGKLSEPRFKRICYNKQEPDYGVD